MSQTTELPENMNFFMTYNNNYEPHEEFNKSIMDDVINYINLFLPTKVGDKYSDWTRDIQDCYSQGCCLNFALALYRTFCTKYNCYIVGKGRIDKSCNIQQIKCQIIQAQYQHYLLMIVDKNGQYRLFDTFGDYDDVYRAGINYWFKTKESIFTDLDRLEERDFFKENGPVTFFDLLTDRANTKSFNVFHVISKDEMERLVKLWNINGSAILPYMD